MFLFKKDNFNLKTAKTVYSLSKKESAMKIKDQTVITQFEVSIHSAKVVENR